MILKNLDSHDKDIEILNSFLLNEKIPKEIKTNIELEIKKIKGGMKGEKESAYELDFKLKDSPNSMVIHNLRLEIHGKVAQIDHLVVDRFVQFYVCESKNFSEGVSINDQLEFTSFYNNKPYAIASPIEQNKKHIDVLKEIFDKDIVELPKRLGFKIKPKYFNCILVSKSSRITRSKKELPEFVKVLKNDQFYDYFYDADNETGSAKDLFKVVSRETIQQLCEKIVELHKPIEFNWKDKFGVAKYLIEEISKKEEVIIIEKAKKITNESEPTEAKNKYCCATCNIELDKGVVFWCRKNKAKFNNQFLCREHQP